ncbi:AI-2E family transporter [Sphingomonas qomolangmaensis]|uniref:AI-2E family transporter n=1 Tax=Sphingomonas qomolangmaensis TaxID=2918765 RepID=A0ABY5L993_9SPHN|nr:AI-2E family transporter [Sphingomonas qomolangmaensis]UUL83544.1 AI-2E family transporter [Sphingomonas qomolangmaensis]
MNNLSPPAEPAFAEQPTDPVAVPGTLAVAAAEEEVPDEPMRRDRLLAALTLMAGVGLFLAIPFALKAGSEFFMPLTAAIVIAIALVPLLEWLERRRVPAPLASLTCVILFLGVANGALASIVVPAWQWVRILPERIEQIQSNIAPLIDFYSNAERFVNRTIENFATAPARKTAEVTTAAPPTGLLDLVGTSAPSAIIEMFFAILVIYFFLSGWTRLRRNAITSRTSFGGAIATARVIQDVVDDTSAYLGTITVINLLLGLIVAAALYVIGMPTPLMWGGIVALLNYIPYFGPVMAALLLALGGLMTYDDIWLASLPAIIMVGAHLIEANAITPLIVGHRLTINPIMILVSLSFWGWVWGTTGALLAVPLLIIIQTVLKAAGKPDIAGFLFEHGTLVKEPPRSSTAFVQKREQSS